MRPLRAAVALVLVTITACGEGESAVSSDDGPPPTRRADPGPIREDPLVEVDCAAAAADPRALATSQELVFDGVVTATSLQPSPEAAYRVQFLDDGLEDPDGPRPTEEDRPSPAGADWPWTTFRVRSWWSQDFGTDIAVWTAGLDMRVGDRWLLAGEAFATPPGLDAPSWQSGMATVCASSPYSPERAAEWSAWFGGSVVAGGDEPEGEPDSVAAGEIEGGRRRWAAQRPPTYTATLTQYDGQDGEYGPARCQDGELTVVVEDGEPVSAVNSAQGCTVDLAVDDVPTIEDFFDRAITASGAASHNYELDPIWGYVRSYGGNDRAIDVSGGVRWFAPGSHPTLVDAELGEELPALRDRWEAREPDTYRFRIEPGCYCGLPALVVTVRDGVATAASPDGSAVDPELVEAVPTTVDALFDQLEDELETSDLVVATVDGETGYPRRVYLDRLSRAIDDELTLEITDLEAL